MSKIPTPIEIEQIFDQIWSRWLNKDGEHAAKKAVGNYFRSGGEKKKLIDACDAYILSNINQDPEFTYKLSNFINGDHYLDILDGISVERLRQKEREARTLMESWNATCRPHWCKISSYHTRLGAAMKALNDPFFRENWKKALDKATKIFQYSFREDDRRKIILSFTWFTYVLPNKHTVAKIMDGEYGYPVKEASSKQKPVLPVDEKARQKALEEWKELMKDANIEIKTKPQRKPKPNAVSDNDKHTKKILESLGIPPEDKAEGDDPFELV